MSIKIILDKKRRFYKLVGGLEFQTRGSGSTPRLYYTAKDNPKELILEEELFVKWLNDNNLVLELTDIEEN